MVAYALRVVHVSSVAAPLPDYHVAESAGIGAQH